jgi:spermidine/putrescine transport system permease protein
MIEATSQSQVQPAAATRAGRRANWRTLLLGIHSTLMYVFLYAPIVVLVLFSFTTDSFGARLTGFTFSWYTRLLQDERLIGAAWNTLKVALASTVLSTIIGTLTALAMERYRFRGRTWHSLPSRSALSRA